MKKKSAPTETSAPEIEVKEISNSSTDKKESEVVLDTLLKISEKIISIEKTINEIQKMQKAGRF